MVDLESAVLSAWYGSRPEVRRLLAMRDAAEGLRVLVELEPAQDSSEIHPAWLAHRHEWADELQWHMGRAIRLEHMGGNFGDEMKSSDVIVVDLCWRDPAFN